MSQTIVLLGPQHPEPTIAATLRSLDIRGPVAVVAAGLQERESEASALPPLGLPAVNLKLHARADVVFSTDTELNTAYKQRQTQLRLMQDFYRVRIDHAHAAARAISVRHVAPDILAAERQVSLDVLRRLDQDHRERTASMHAEFVARWQPLERAAVARHRKKLAAIIASTDALVIAGGQIATLLNRLRLFSLIELIGDRPIVAWSAGAMVLSERVILFHDNPPHGEPIAELLDNGLGLVRDTVVLPDPRVRLRLDDADRVGELAGRFAPAACIGMPPGSSLRVAGGAVVASSNTLRLNPDGTVRSEGDAAPLHQPDHFVP